MCDECLEDKEEAARKKRRLGKSIGRQQSNFQVK